MRYIVDLDDTISVHRNRDYVNATPRNLAIERLREIRKIDKDSQIIIHTARGMNSCRGNVALAREKNEGIIKDWLLKHSVPYDEIIFGKPLGDVYIDDKAVHTSDFDSCGVERASGFSGSDCFIVGRKIVIKHCKNAQMQSDWYLDFEANFGKYGVVAKTPRVYAITLGALYLEFVPDNGGDVPLPEIIKIIRAFESVKENNKNDILSYSKYVAERADRFGLIFDSTPLYSFILERRTFCHGDFTRSNIRYMDEKGVYLIDPIRRADISSYLLDAAKYRLSLRGLDRILKGENGLAKETAAFDLFFTGDELEIIDCLEKTQLLRILPYAEKKSKDILNSLIKLYKSL